MGALQAKREKEDAVFVGEVDVFAEGGEGGYGYCFGKSMGWQGRGRSLQAEVCERR